MRKEEIKSKRNKQVNEEVNQRKTKRPYRVLVDVILFLVWTPRSMKLSMKLCMLNNCLQCFKVSLRTLTASVCSHLFHDCTNVVNVILYASSEASATFHCYVWQRCLHRRSEYWVQSWNKTSTPLFVWHRPWPTIAHSYRDGCDRTVSKLKTLLHLTSIWRVF